MLRRRFLTGVALFAFTGSALADGGTQPPYAAQGSFTPQATFVTPGDLTVAYTTQIGTFSQVGNLVYVSVQLVFTPTYTTASGFFRVSGLPISSTVQGAMTVSAFSGSTAITWPGSGTMVVGNLVGSGMMQLVFLKTGAAFSTANTGSIVSGNAITLTFSGVYSL